MADLLDDVKKFFSRKDINKDNRVFKLFSKVAVGACFLGSILCVSTTYFGDPIHCSVKGDSSIDPDMMKSHCWIHGSYQIKEAYQELCFTTDKESTAFYQWVALMLVIHGLIFMFPSQLWNCMEGGVMRDFGNKAKSPTILARKDELNYALSSHVDYFNSLHGTTTSYFFKFFFCELLNITAAITNFCIANTFLNGKFHNYGADVISYYRSYDPIDETKVTNPMCEAFPTTVSCTLTGSAPTGSKVVAANALCILSQNIINEKIYLVLWFLFMVLFAASGLILFFRILHISFPKFRAQVIKSHMDDKYSTPRGVEVMLSKMTIGDYFVLHQLSTNCHKVFFREFIERLAEYRYNGRNEDFLKAEEILMPRLPAEGNNLPEANANAEI